MLSTNQRLRTVLQCNYAAIRSIKLGSPFSVRELFTRRDTGRPAYCRRGLAGAGTNLLEPATGQSP